METSPGDKLSAVLASCGFTHVEIPAEGPGCIYVVMVVPHLETAYGLDEEDETEEYDEVEDEYDDPDGPRDDDLDGSTAVRVYAIPDTEIGAEQRATLRLADAVDLTFHPHSLPAPDDKAAAARQVDQWLTAGPWDDRLALCYNNDPLTVYGSVRDRPTALIMITLPADVWDPIASRY